MGHAVLDMQCSHGIVLFTSNTRLKLVTAAAKRTALEAMLPYTMFVNCEFWCLPDSQEV